MNHKPTLEELGLDAPVDKVPFGKAFANYDSSKEDQPKTWVDSVKVSRSDSYGQSDLIAAIFAGFLGPVGFWYKSCWIAGFGWLVWMVLSLLIGIVFPLFPLVAWVLMIIHAYKIDPGKRI